MLTKRQKQILDYIEKFVEKNDYSPTLEEIKDYFGLSSVATVHQHIENLRGKGYLNKIDNQPRTIDVFENGQMVQISLLGTIAAGAPIEAIENKEIIAIPKSKLPKSGDFFALRVEGESMIDENINNGDVIIVKRQPVADNGQRVVALIDNEEVTLKKFYKEKNKIRLQPANPKMEPLTIEPSRIIIRGIVVDVIKAGTKIDSEKIVPQKIRPPNDKNYLKKERKVKNRQSKEKIRGGTKFYKKAIETKEPDAINEFLNKIVCGDSEKMLKKIPENSIDIIITSPPYNFGLEYENDKNNDAVEWNKYFEKLNAIWRECARVLKPGGRLCVNVQPLFSDYIPTHHYISKQLLDLGLLWKGEILWEKNNYNCKYTAWGSWKSPSMPYLKYTWEFIEVFCKKTHKKVGERDNIDISGKEFKNWVYAKWKMAPERNMKEYDHPAMFPEELPARLMKLFSYKNDIVLDPFNGVGTTTVAAKKLNRRFIGIDISQEYCNKAVKRSKETLF